MVNPPPFQDPVYYYPFLTTDQVRALEYKWLRETSIPAQGIKDVFARLGNGPFMYTGITWDGMFKTIRVVVRPRNREDRFAPVEVELNCKNESDPDSALDRFEKFMDLRYAEWLLVRDAQDNVRTKMWVE